MATSKRTFSVVIRETGEVRDISFKRYQKFDDGGGIYLVFLGDLRLGQVTWLGSWFDGWDAVSYRDYDKMTRRQAKHLEKFGVVTKPEDIRPNDPMHRVDGFKTRRAAAVFLVRHWGFWKGNEE